MSCSSLRVVSGESRAERGTQRHHRQRNTVNGEQERREGSAQPKTRAGDEALRRLVRPKVRHDERRVAQLSIRPGPSMRTERRRPRTAGVLAGWASGVSPLAGGRRDAAAPAAETAAVRRTRAGYSRICTTTPGSSFCIVRRSFDDSRGTASSWVRAPSSLPLAARRCSSSPFGQSMRSIDPMAAL